jgi:hypothetical protein
VNNSSDSVLARITEVCDSVIDFYGNRVGTHSASCYRRHPDCLAHLIRGILEEEQ